MRLLLSAVLIVLISFSVNAQTQKTVWGYLKDSITKEPVVLASITNLNTNRTVMTDNSGLFKIELAENQILSYSAVGYYLDTLIFNERLLNKDTLFLYIAPLVHVLGNGTVSAKGYSTYQLDSMERRRSFLQDIVNYQIPTMSASNSGAGIALNIDHFSRREKNKRKAFRFFETNEKEAYINYRFPGETVTRYSGLKGQELQFFMQLYRPSYEWLRANTTEEDIKYYINEKLKERN